MGNADSLTPPNLDFFELFTSLAETVRLGADQYFNLLKDFTEVPTKVDEIIGTEHRGDQVTREIMRARATTFVAPFDSGDISDLASGLDTILDHIEAAADYLSLHQIEAAAPNGWACRDPRASRVSHRRRDAEAQEPAGTRLLLRRGE